MSYNLSYLCDNDTIIFSDYDYAVPINKTFVKFKEKVRLIKDLVKEKEEQQVHIISIYRDGKARAKYNPRTGQLERVITDHNLYKLSFNNNSSDKIYSMRLMEYMKKYNKDLINNSNIVMIVNKLDLNVKTLATKIEVMGMIFGTIKKFAIQSPCIKFNEKNEVEIYCNIQEIKYDAISIQSKNLI